MNNIRNKLRSRRGASITFALLAFMVCAIISIVVVVAGSAAAGRMSQRAEVDQRYYSVSSAVELLCDLFNKKTAEVEYKLGKGSPRSGVRSSDIVVNFVVDTAGEDVMESIPLVKAVSRDLVEMIAKETDSKTYALTISPQESPDPKADLNCTVQGYLYRDGRLVFAVSNDGDTKYTLQATFTAIISESTREYLNDEDEMLQDVTTTIVWNLNGIKKGA